MEKNESRLHTADLKKFDILAAILLLAGAVFLVLRAPYGFGHDDESFYLSIPFRLISGDSLLSDEWHLSQLSAFLMYIPVKLFVAIKGTTEGIIIFFRYFYILMQFACSVMIYIRFRKHGLSAVAACVLFFIHTPLGIMTLSYNTMGLVLVEIIGLILSAYKRLKTPMYVLTGILFSFAVLCNPVLSFIFAIYTVMMIIFVFAKKGKIKNLPEKLFSLKSWLLVFSGIVTVFVTFIIFVLSRAGMKELLENLPMLFTDPEYRFSSGSQNVFTLLNSIISLFKSCPIGFALSVIILVVSLADKNRNKNRKIYLAISSLIFIINVIVLALPVTEITDIYGLYKYYYWMFPLSLYGLNCYLLTEKKNKSIFVSLWIFGIVYALCIDVSSDAAPITSTMALAVSDTASVIFLGQLFSEIKNEATENKKNVFVSLVSVLAVIAVFAQAVLEITVNCDLNRTCDEVLFMTPKQKISEKIDSGPLKGVLTTPTRAKIYNNTIDDLNKIKNECKGKVLVCDNYAWAYLYLEKDYATYSTWCLSAQWFNGYSQRLKEYYRLHPENMPEYAYVPYFSAEVTKYDYDNAEKVMEDLTASYGGKVTYGKEGYIIRF